MKRYPIWGPFPESWGTAPPYSSMDTAARRSWIAQNEEADELAAAYQPGGGQLSARAARRVLEAWREPRE